ncbi:MAG: outer membrane beta-barrel protein [candidate division WOR-3 bacterium]|nr:MAG: outer membrane beta-barrel protein [candidate division WOR-3 bacterium]
MKKLIFVLVLLTAWCAAQCLSAPISTRVGVKFGINPGTYSLDDGLDEFKGTGVHFGIGMGTDILNLISLDMGAQFRTTIYSRSEEFLVEYTHSYSYNNLYFPIFLSIKAGMLPLVSPYVGVGLGINVQYNGIEKEETNGVTIETPIEGANTNAFFILGLGAEIKLLKLRISPEFTANINAQADNEATEATEENIDYHISLGLYYAP